jgi:hypothetical protein
MHHSAETSAAFRGADAEEIQRRKRSYSVPKVMSAGLIELSKSVQVGPPAQARLL